MPAEDKGVILLVEDDEYIRSVYKIALEGEGFTVDLAENGLEALDKLSKQVPKLILLDIIMPRMDGFEVLDKIRSQSEYDHVPIVMCSNLSQNKEIKQSMDGGANDYLLKGDISLKELVDKVNKNLPEE